MFLSIGVDFPKANTIISFDNSIAYTNANVKCPKEKANEMLQSARLQLPLEETFISFDNSITQLTANVKHANKTTQKNILKARKNYGINSYCFTGKLLR
jgi:hypothetical protein